MSTAYEVAKWLESQSLGAFGGSTSWSLHVNREPANPHNVVTLYDTGGLEPDTDELDVLRPSFQVRTRSSDQLQGWARQEAIRDALILPRGAIVMADHTYGLIALSSAIAPIGFDDSNRFLLVANYRCIKERL